MKRTAVLLLALIAASTLFLSTFSFAATKTMKFMVFSKEKTVLADGVEVKGVKEFEYKIEKNKTTTASKEGVYYSFQGDVVSGKITLDSSSEVLCKHHKGHSPFLLNYYLSSKEKVSRYEFTGARITGMSTKGSGKDRETVYTFESSGLREHK